MVDDGSSEDTARYPDGALKYTGRRIDGELHGDWRWYRADGTLMRSGAFDRGRQIGTWRTYDRSAKVVKETTFGD